ncbi:glycosyl hydrolase family 28-related protein [Roseivivax sp. CAU 1761]
MNKAITDGLVFMPTPFADGLDRWSRQNGVPGSDTYQSDANAAFVPADQDFGGALEVLKTEGTQKLRYMGETPILPGTYLRITARVKAISGNLPAVRIAGHPVNASGGHVAGLAEVGAGVPLTAYGSVVEVSAIVGTGSRGGVDMVWGTAPAAGHFGIDLTGPTGGVVRIDDIVIEDVTEVFLRDMLAMVDVRDFGAVGDGSSDDSGAFEAADAAAGGRTVLVSAGTYRLESSVTFDSHVRFEGTVTMPDAAILSLTKDFHLPAYIDAFGDEELALKKALQSLFNNSDHESLDMAGRRVNVTAPIDVHAAVANRESFAQRRVLKNGQLRALTSAAWDNTVVSSRGTYSAAAPTRLDDVDNAAAIPVGALVTGAGVGREVYVRAVNPGARTVTLSQPLYDAEGSQTFTFIRYRFMLDFSGFERLDVFQIEDVEFQCAEIANGVMLAPEGLVMQIRRCAFNRPHRRAITSPGNGCQGMIVESCNFTSHEADVLAQNRLTVALNTNGQDVKLKNCRASYSRHFLVASGAQSLVSGNHFFQGDSAPTGLRTAGIVIARRACNSTIDNNYIDNCFIEWTNEREPEPDYTGGFGFAGLSVTSNICLASQVATTFSFLVVRPYGSNHRLNGVTVAGNTFRVVGRIERVERVDTSFAPLNLDASNRVTFEGNTFNNIVSANPLVLQHAQASHADTWVVATGGRLAFDGRALEVDALALRSRLRNSANGSEWAMPYAVTRQGPGLNDVHVIFPVPVRGDLSLTVRMD